MNLSATIKHELVPETVKPVTTIDHKALYNQYSKAMFNTCLRIVNNRADAEDILQEAFLDAFRGLDGFHSRSTFGAWLKRIVVNKSINKIKRQKMYMVALEDTGVSGIAADEAEDEEALEYRVEEVRKAIQLLPVGYRTVFSLRLLEDYKFEEIAEVMQISSITARSQYIRAKKKLIEIIKGGGMYEK